MSDSSQYQAEDDRNAGNRNRAGDEITNESRPGIQNTRLRKNPGLEARGAKLEELAPYISGRVSGRGWKEGLIDEGMYFGGQVVGRIHDIPTVAELMQRIIDEALEAKKRMDGLFK